MPLPPMTEPSPGPLDAPVPPDPAPGGGRTLVLPLLLAALLAVVVFRHGPRLYDDAFITMRYARNLIDGYGLVYNPGERVLGTSAPLYALVLALPALVLGAAALPAISTAIGLAALFGTALVSFRLVSRFAPAWAAALGVAAALTPVDTLQVFASGMETPVYLFGLAFAVERLAAGRLRLALLVAVALPFLHPEGALLFPALLVAARVTRGRWPFREAIAPAVAAAAGALALALAFGSPLPHSVTAKRLVYERAPGAALRDLGGSVVGVFLPPPAPAAVAERLGEELTVAEIAVLLALLCLLGLVLLRHRRALREGPAVALALFAALYVAFFAAGNPLVFPCTALPSCSRRASSWPSSSGGRSARGRARRPPRAPSRVSSSSASRAVSPSSGPSTRVSARTSTARPPSRWRLPPTRWSRRPRSASSVSTPAPVCSTRRDSSPRGPCRSSPLPRPGPARPPRPGCRPGTIPPRLIAALAPDFVVTRSRFLEPLLRVEPSALDGYERLDLGLGPRAVEAQLFVYRRLSAPAAGPSATK